MAHSILNFTPAKKLVIIQRFGDINLSELLAGVGRMFDDPRMEEVMFVLSDLRNANLAVTSSEMSRHADYCREQFKDRDTKIAVVAERNVDFGMARMFEQLSTLEFVATYHSVEDAYKWFDIPYDPSDWPETDNT